MSNRYSFSEFTSTAWALVCTKISFRGARLVRRPVYVRGRKSLVFGRGFTTGHGCRFDLDGSKKTLFIGENVQLNDYVHISAHERVEIGDGCLFASKIYITDSSHGDYSGEAEGLPDTPPAERPLVTSPVTIGKNVWVGENAVILAGARIGDGAVIGANSVVKGSIPAACIAVGAPARVVKRFCPASGSWERSE